MPFVVAIMLSLLAPYSFYLFSSEKELLICANRRKFCFVCIFFFRCVFFALICVIFSQAILIILVYSVHLNSLLFIVYDDDFFIFVSLLNSNLCDDIDQCQYVYLYSFVFIFSSFNHCSNY